MLTILKLLGGPLIDAALSAFGHVLMDFLRSRQAMADAQARGRAEAVAEAAAEAARIEREMGAVATPEREELLRRLREGNA